MGKKQLSVTVDEDVKEYLDRRDELNVSAIVNRFLNHYTVGGDVAEIALLIRLQDIEDQIGELQRKRGQLETNLNRLQRERQRIEERIEDRQTAQHEIIERARETIGTPSDPENPAVQNWAQKAGMTPTEFVEALHEET